MAADVIDRVYRSIVWLENNAGEDFSPAEAMAEIASLSPYHFSRVFHSMTGLSPGLYVRRRKLTRAAEVLARQDTPVIQVALEAGYDSQEAFTRAFKDMFGVTPGAARAKKPDLDLSGQTPLSKADLEHFSSGGLTLEPTIRTGGGFTVSGLGGDFGFAQVWEINGLWKDFIPRLIGKGVEPGLLYGVCRGTTTQGHPSKVFHYTAGYNAGGATPEGMENVEIPQGKYAVFLHNGHIGDMDATLRYIWQVWVPRSGYELADAPDFEFYESWSEGQKLEGEIEIWIPVVA